MKEDEEKASQCEHVESVQHIDEEAIWTIKASCPMTKLNQQLNRKETHHG